MGYSTDLSTYPLEFAQMYDRAQRESFEVDLADRGLALSFVHKLHAYRRAVETAKVPGYQNLRNVVIRCRGTRVIFDNNSQAMAAFRAAAGVTEPTEAELEAYMQKAFNGDKANAQDESTIERRLLDTSSREQGVREESTKDPSVETDYLKLFQKEERGEDET